MKPTNSELRKQARMTLEGHWGGAVVATLIFFIVGSVLPNISLLFPLSEAGQVSWNLVWSFLLIPLSWGFCIYFLSLLRDQNPQVGSIFGGYKDFVRVFTTMLLMSVYIALWLLLLIVPGIIKSLSYAMTPYILRDNPNVGAVEAIHKSRLMMDGSKMKLFLLYLSFIGWGILCVLTCGIGFLLLVPYVQTSLAAFYEDLRKEEAAQVEETVVEPVQPAE